MTNFEKYTKDKKTLAKLLCDVRINCKQFGIDLASYRDSNVCRECPLWAAGNCHIEAIEEWLGLGVEE